MVISKWNRYRSSGSLEVAEFSHRVRRVTRINGSSFIMAEVSSVHNPGDKGFVCGWQYLIYNISKDGFRRESNIYSDELKTRELAMFMADLKLLDLGFSLDDPFGFTDD